MSSPGKALTIAAYGLPHSRSQYLSSRATGLLGSLFLIQMRVCLRMSGIRARASADAFASSAPGGGRAEGCAGAPHAVRWRGGC